MQATFFALLASLHSPAQVVGWRSPRALVSTRFDATPWLGLGARAGTPAEIIHRLNETARRALARPETLARLQHIGIETRPMTPVEFAAFIRAETDKWGAVIRRAGAKAE